MDLDDVLGLVRRVDELPADSDRSDAIFDHLQATLNIALCIGNGFAMLGR